MLAFIAEKIEIGQELNEVEAHLTSLDPGLAEDLNHLVIAKELGVSAPEVWRLAQTEPGWIRAAIVALEADRIVSEQQASKHGRKGG